MADELSEPVAHGSDAHEGNGVREDPACQHLSDSDAAIIDGATENRKGLHG